MDIISIFSQLVFPVAVAAYLLWERTQTTEKLKNSIVELKMAIYLILGKLNAIPEFEELIQNEKRKKEESKNA